VRQCYLNKKHMVKKITLSAESRTETNGQAKDIIKLGFIPAVLYGQGIENRNLKIKTGNFLHVIAEAGESHLIDLVIDGKDNTRVLIKDLQKDPLKNKVIHADLYQVNMKKAVEVEIPLHFIGESKAVKELGGTLVKNIDFLNVKCLPSDLVDNIEIDLSVLATYNDSIMVKDLKLSAGFEILNHADDMIVHVMEPSAEEVVETVPAAAAPAETAKPAGEEKKEAPKK
jgi:large subunit ribosomal protein L25